MDRWHLAKQGVLWGPLSGPLDPRLLLSPGPLPTWMSAQLPVPLAQVAPSKDPPPMVPGVGPPGSCGKQSWPKVLPQELRTHTYTCLASELRTSCPQRQGPSQRLTRMDKSQVDPCSWEPSVAASRVRGQAWLGEDSPIWDTRALGTAAGPLCAQPGCSGWARPQGCGHHLCALLEWVESHL